MIGLPPSNHQSANPHSPIEPVLERVDPVLATPISLSNDEFGWLVDFVRAGLLDKRARSEQLRKLVPQKVPSGRPTLDFEFETLKWVGQQA